jgi:hypothetical protein
MFQTGKVTDKTKHGLLAFIPVNQAEMGITERNSKGLYKILQKIAVHDRGSLKKQFGI